MSTQYRRCLVIGTGGVGFWLSTALARSLPFGVELVCFDADSFEGGLGHARLPKVSNAATKKVTFLRGYVQMIMGDRPPTVVADFFIGIEAGEGDLVVDCSDMPLDKRKLVWKVASTNGAELIRVSYDGLNETVVVAQGLPLAHSGRPGYSARPLLDLSFAAGGLGSIVVRKILLGEISGHVEFQVSVNDLLGLNTEIATKSPAKPSEVVNTPSATS